MNGVLRFGSTSCPAVLKYFPGYVLPSEHPPENTQHQVVIDKIYTVNLYLTSIILQALGCIKLFKEPQCRRQLSDVNKMVSYSASRSTAHQHSSRLNCTSIRSTVTKNV